MGTVILSAHTVSQSMWLDACSLDIDAKHPMKVFQLGAVFYRSLGQWR